jgi:hypothetical protein
VLQTKPACISRCLSGAGELGCGQCACNGSVGAVTPGNDKLRELGAKGFVEAGDQLCWAVKMTVGLLKVEGFRLCEV